MDVPCRQQKDRTCQTGADFDPAGQPLKSSKICVGAGGHLNRATGDSRDSKGSDPFVLLRGLLILELGSYGGEGVCVTNNLDW